MLPADKADVYLAAVVDGKKSDGPRSCDLAAGLENAMGKSARLDRVEERQTKFTAGAKRDVEIGRNGVPAVAKASGTSARLGVKHRVRAYSVRRVLICGMTLLPRVARVPAARVAGRSILCASKAIRSRVWNKAS